MRRLAPVAVLGASLAVAACSDPVAPTSSARDATSANLATAPTIAEVFARFVALGTSNSMGVQSAGISPPANRRPGLPSSPDVRVCLRCRSCRIPGVVRLLPPLASDAVLLGAFGNDLVTTVMNTCAPLRSSVALPANSVAISGADVHDALTATVESKMALSARRDAL
jgi:hypothetical protein